MPFHRWRNSLGHVEGHADPAEARRLARHVDRAAGHLPFETKCLPRAMALSWMLNCRGIAHGVVIAVRPRQDRDEGHGRDALHAWVSCTEEIVLGELPGPWMQVWRGG